MKKQITKGVLMVALLGGAWVFQGCVAIPPLIQVQHKDNNDDIKRRLDSIDRRLDRIEDEKSGTAPQGK